MKRLFFFLPYSQIEVHTAHTSSVQHQNSHPYSHSAARPRKTNIAQLETPAIDFTYKLHFLKKY